MLVAFLFTVVLVMRRFVAMLVAMMFLFVFFARRFVGFVLFIHTRADDARGGRPREEEEEVVADQGDGRDCFA